MSEFEEKRLLSMSSFCEYADMSRATAREFLKDKSFAVRISPRKVFVSKEGFDAWVTEHSREFKCDSVFAARSRRRTYYE